uniref:Cytoplasmic envelopment protein 3 n=1 Tax=Human cytomegalovirus TaxID=10359 RepID=D6NSB1_HCMV|nr:UL99 protein [Human betaherpesvirus 5]
MGAELCKRICCEFGTTPGEPLKDALGRQVSLRSYDNIPPTSSSDEGEDDDDGEDDDNEERQQKLRLCGSGCGGNDSSSGSHREATHDGSKKNAVRSTFREDKAPKPSKQSKKKKKKPSKHHHHQQSSIMQETDDLDEEDTSIYLSPRPVPPVQVVAKRLPRPDTPRTRRQKKISQRPSTPGTKKPAAPLPF